MAGVQQIRCGRCEVHNSSMVFFMTEPESKSTAVTIFADRSFGPEISRFLFGKFTEHLGRNVYGGAWAETVENPWFASLGHWPNPDVDRQRLQDLTRFYELPDLAACTTQVLVPYWMPRGQVQASPSSAALCSRIRCSGRCTCTVRRSGYSRSKSP